MKAGLFICLLALVGRPAAALMIIEVQIAGDRADHDYVRIFNPKEKDLELGGYRLVKRSSTGREYSLRVFPRETIIPARSYLTWANSRDGFAESMEAELASTATLASNNSVALLDPDRNIVDALCWGQGQDQFGEAAGRWPNPQANQQIIRRKDNGDYVSTGSNLDDFKLAGAIELAVPTTYPTEPPRRYPARPFGSLFWAAAIIGLFSVKVFSYYYQKQIET